MVQAAATFALTNRNYGLVYSSTDLVRSSSIAVVRTLGEVNPEADVRSFAARVDAACRSLSYLLRRIATRLARRVPAHIEVDELISAGAVGLVLAVRQHLDKPEIELKRLAVQRIRGAILDHLRSSDHLTRRQRAAVGSMQRVKARLERDGVCADLGAVAKSMGISLDRARELNDGLAAVHITSLSSEESLMDVANDPSQLAVSHDLHSHLVRALKNLPERLQMLMSFYYYEELTYQEISEILGISRSRICQLHTQAMDQLREQLSVIASDV